MALRRFWSAEAGIFVGIWLALMLLGRSTLLRDPGTFWHVRTGQMMLGCGAVAQTDPFSFTHYGRPWVAYQWLAECGMAAIHRLSGFDGLLLVTATVLAGVYTWVASRLLRAGFHVLLAGFLLALVLLASSHQFHARPLILTIGLLGVNFAWLVDVEAGRRGLGRLWWLVPINVVWANLHAGVLAGIGTTGLVVLGWALAWALGRPSPIRRRGDLVGLALLLLACSAAVLVNPYGLGLPRCWLRTLAVPLPELIEEHRPLDLAEPLGWTVLLLGLGYLVAMAGVVRRRPRASELLPLVWLILAWQRVRNAPLLAITAALAAAELLPASRWADWLRRGEWLLPAETPEEGSGASQQDSRQDAARGIDLRPMAVPVLLIGLTMLLQVAGVRVPVVGRGWARLDATTWPVELLPQLERINGDSPEGTPIFNDLNFGGLLIYYAPRLQVFVDDRCALYGAEFLEEYNHARTSDPAQLDRWQRQYGFRYALVATDTPFDRHLEGSEHWWAIGRTPVATLYVKAARSGASATDGPE